jgi:cytosine/adenosine deaminase-related metal-dependent hydrolase
MPESSLKIEHARYVVTVDRERRIIQDGSILIDRGRIVRVGKADQLVGASADRVIDARRMVVTPGFFNGHMHISYAHPVRGIFPDDLGSPLSHVFKLQMAMTEEEEYHTSLLGIVELLKNGTVCFLDPGSTKFPDACLQAYADAGISSPALLAANPRPDGYSRRILQASRDRTGGFSQGRYRRG